MLRNRLYEYSAKLPCRIINTDGNRYLERYYLGQFLNFTFYLHRFVDGDGDRSLHDHPWKVALGICLAGGYQEERVRWFNPKNAFDTQLKKVRPGSFNLIFATTFHQVLKTEPNTWTFFVHSKKVKEWGFLSRKKQQTNEGEWEIQPYYHGDWDEVSHINWWETAPIGKYSDRAPK